MTLHSWGTLYGEKTFTIISFENKTDARVYSTVFMIDGNCFQRDLIQFEGCVTVAVKMTVIATGCKPSKNKVKCHKGE